MRRRVFLVAGAAATLLGAAPRRARIVTYRDRGCGCCEGWVAAARTAGYSVEMHDVDRAERIRRFRLSDATAGCHTSLVGGYIVEGHVPLDVVARLLSERPHIRGITAPGMPTGVPGMDAPRPGPLDILTLEHPPRLYVWVP
jgi:hypothetical protein